MAGDSVSMIEDREFAGSTVQPGSELLLLLMSGEQVEVALSDGLGIIGAADLLRRGGLRVRRAGRRRRRLADPAPLSG